VKLLVKKIDNDGRLGMLPGLLATPWDIEVVDSDNSAQFEHALRAADAMVSMSWRGPMPPAPRLQLLQALGAGVDEIDFALLPPWTAVCNCFEHETAIAEYVLAAMLEWTIGVRRMDARLRRGDWTGSYLCGPRHGELHGKTLGIVGYGRIGREVARRASAFGMRIRVCGRVAGAGDDVSGPLLGMDQLPQLLGQCDFVLVSAPLTEQTRGLFGTAAFAAMRADAVIINVARGAIIDEGALYHALRGRRIGGAIIDVWYRYPPQGVTKGPEPSTSFQS
jgi:phosphoglycerate dehydrogenase-like enzyme